MMHTILIFVHSSSPSIAFILHPVFPFQDLFFYFSSLYHVTLSSVVFLFSIFLVSLIHRPTNHPQTLSCDRSFNFYLLPPAIDGCGLSIFPLPAHTIRCSFLYRFLRQTVWLGGKKATNASPITAPILSNWPFTTCIAPAPCLQVSAVVIDLLVAERWILTLTSQRGRCRTSLLKVLG